MNEPFNQPLNEPLNENVNSFDLSQAPENLGARAAIIGGVVVISILMGWMLLNLPLVVVAGVFVGTVFVAISLANPYWGLMGYLVWEFVRPAEMFPALAPFHLQRVIAMVVMAAWLLSRLRKDTPPLVASRQNKLMLLFGVVMLLSVATAVYRSQAFDFASDFFKIILIYFLIINLLSTQQKLNRFVWLFMALNGWVAFGVIKAYLTGDVVYSDGITRSIGLTAFMGDPNDLATSLAAAIPFAIFLFPAVKSKFGKFAMIILLISSLVAITFTGSRGGTIALAVMIFTLWLRSRYKVKAGFGLLVLMIAFWVLAPGGYRQRILSIHDFRNDATSVSRQESWKAGIFLFKHHPILGVGGGNFGVARAQQYAVTGSYADWQTAHSIYFQLLAELGFFGITSFLILVWSTFKDTKNTRCSLEQQANANLAIQMTLAIDVALVAFLSGGAFLSLAYHPTIYYLIAIAVAQKHIADQKAVPAEALEDVTVHKAIRGAYSWN